jgi:hypothetical protein
LLVAADADKVNVCESGMCGNAAELALLLLCSLLLLIARQRGKLHFVAEFLRRVHHTFINAFSLTALIPIHVGDEVLNCGLAERGGRGKCPISYTCTGNFPHLLIFYTQQVIELAKNESRHNVKKYPQ